MAWMQILMGLMSLSYSQEIHGHRGARAIYPENTLVAFEYALNNGADSIELDTHLTADGHVIVHHDPVINKSICRFENGDSIRKDYIIFQHTLDTIKQFDCGAKTLRAFPRQIRVAGSKIPTLQEVIDLLKVQLLLRPHVKLNIEIKHDKSFLYPSLKPYVESVVNLVRENQLQNHVIYQSFSKEVIQYVKIYEPLAHTYFLFSSGFTNYQAVLKETDADGISAEYSIVTTKMVETIRNLNKKILSWTVNDPSAWKRLVQFGVDGIITDDPEGLYRYKQEIR